MSSPITITRLVWTRNLNDFYQFQTSDSMLRSILTSPDLFEEVRTDINHLDKFEQFQTNLNKFEQFQTNVDLFRKVYVFLKYFCQG